MLVLTHSLPHFVRVWSTHFVPQRPALHVGSKPLGAVQGTHEEPQVSTAVLLTQRPPHSCWPTGHLHNPSEQLCSALQAFPQKPQFILSDAKLTHAPRHSEVPVLHTKSQRPFVQTSLARATPELHTSQELPQALTASLGSHAPEHSCVPEGHVQVPFLHIVPPEHALLQEPQCCASTLGSTQVPPHFMKPLAHSKSQRPSWHTGSA
jgi:hypothetical protein